MAMSAREYDFSKLLEKFLTNNCPSMDIVKFSNHYKENCVLVLNELMKHKQVQLQLEF
jgi:hypothetical protein